MAAALMRVAIVANARDEDAFLLEWCCYHLALGVDKIFLYDHLSTNPVAGFIEPFLKDEVEVREWKVESKYSPSGPIYTAWLSEQHAEGVEWDWVLFIDLDEYVGPVLDRSIPDLLRRLQRSDILIAAANFVWFTGLHLEDRDEDKTTVEQFTRQSITAGRLHTVKTFAQVKRVDRMRDPHRPGTRRHPRSIGRPWRDFSGAQCTYNDIKDRETYDASIGVGYIAHYRRSLSDFRVKVKRDRRRKYRRGESNFSEVEEWGENTFVRDVYGPMQRKYLDEVLARRMGEEKT